MSNQAFIRATKLKGYLRATKFKGLTFETGATQNFFFPSTPSLSFCVQKDQLKAEKQV